MQAVHRKLIRLFESISLAELTEWHDRIVADLPAWQADGVRISTVSARHDGVGVEIGTESYTANAEILTEGPERQRLYDQQAALMPNFAEYQEKTDRVIPVVVLTRA